MIKNYLKIASRSIWKYKGYAFINIAGLAIGMAVCVLIILWVIDELSFDRFHQNADRIYRIGVDLNAGTQVRMPISMPAAPLVMVQDFPEVINFARMDQPRKALVQYKNMEFQEDLVCFADNSLLQVFNFPLLRGDPNTALVVPYSVVISEDMAHKYFADEDPLGKMLRIGGDQDYAITGIVKNAPHNSHIRFHMICSFETLYARNRQDLENWLNIQYYTYLLLSDTADPAALEMKFPALVDRNMGAALKSLGGSLVLFLQPLTRIHLHSHLRGELSANGNIGMIYLFSGIALFILVIACINFINLATARSSIRVKEVGMRKTLGAAREKLVMQFLGESIVHSLLSFILAVLMLLSILPFYGSFTGRELGIDPLKEPWFFPVFLGLALVVGILAGSFPAFYLSSFQPIRALKCNIIERGSNNRFRNILVIVQFTISVILIIGTITITGQIHYMKHKNPGFNEEHLVIIPGVKTLLRQQSFESLKNELMGLPGVVNIAGSSLVPGAGVQLDIFFPEGFSQNQPQTLTRLEIDPNYTATMAMTIVAGRNFSTELESDPAQSLLINEMTASYLGWSDPVGKAFIFRPDPGKEGETRTMRVVGVVRDFHFTSLHKKIEPLVLFYNLERINYLSVRIASENIPNTIDSLKKKWRELDPSRPFTYYFLDEIFDQMYKSEERFSKITFSFSVLAIFIACLGLFGMASFLAERRTKEIGIRKVLGASVTNIVRLLSTEFIILVAIANLVAWPFAYLGVNNWLENFAYRIHVGWSMFLLAGILSLVIALMTVSYQAIKASLSNPVEAIRYE